MDNPGVSLFQNGDMLNLNSSHNNDQEEEDLEEQKRRNEEIQNLLMTKLDDFNYDDSTVNSSANISLDEAQKNYRNAVDPNEQLRVLYDVRVRELNSLKEKFDQLQAEKSREIDELKSRLFIFEAENNQLKMSLRNAEELLVQKTSINNELMNQLNILEETVKKYEKMIEEFQFDINTYQSTINELQMKLQSEPFNSGKNKFNSTELQKAHQEQITKLESLLEQQKRNTDKYEKELAALREDLRRMSAIQSDDKNAMNILTKNFDSAQKQCYDLIDVIEKLSEENKHLKARLNEVYKEINISQEAESPQIERLKKALVDKSMEMDALKVKARHFEENVKELMEYRELKCDMYKKEFQQCENKDHIRGLLLMQNDIQNYKRIIDDKNQQILTLDSTNKNLVEKMELMLSQTRNDIQNFSSKYNLPQLEEMAEELKKSEEIIKDLEFQLKKSEERRHSLHQKLQKTSMSPSKDRKEMELKINNLEKERNNFLNELKRLQKDLEVSQVEIKNLKDYTKELIEENTKLKMKSPEKNEKGEQELKERLLESIESVQTMENKIQKLEDTIQQLSLDKADLENDNDNLQLRLKETEQITQNYLKQVEHLQSEIAKLSNDLQSKDEIIEALKKNNIERIESELAQSLKISEENREELLQSLAKTSEELEIARVEIIALQEQLKEVKEQNLRIIQANVPEEIRSEDIEAAQRLSIELKLREELRADFHEKLEDVEKKYSASYKTLYKEQSKKLKIYELDFRNRMVMVLKECAQNMQKIEQLETQNSLLMDKVKEQQKEFEDFRNQVAISEAAYKNVISQAQHSAQRDVEEWRRMSKMMLNKALGIQSTSKITIEKVVNDMDKFDLAVATIVKSYNNKLKKAGG